MLKRKQNCINKVDASVEAVGWAVSKRAIVSAAEADAARMAQR